MWGGGCSGPIGAEKTIDFWASGKYSMSENVGKVYG